MSKEENQTTSIKSLVKKNFNYKFLYLKVAIITVIVASLIIVPLPRYYSTKVILAPEQEAGTEGRLSSIASSMGIDLNTSMALDAISPTIYPDLISSNDFIYTLINTPVTTKDGKIKCSYYEYLTKHNKAPYYSYPMKWIKKLFHSQKAQEEEIHISHLTKAQEETFEAIKGKIDCDNDIKTGLITISVTDQDPQVASIIADKVRINLQDFITDYRTKKARNDLNYYKKLCAEAKAKYEKSRFAYSSFSDANMDVILESFKSKQEDLENQMQLNFNSYSMLQKQLENAYARVQERTPAFTVIQNASCPNKPAGPKRMAFVFVMFLISMIITFVYINNELFIKK